MGKRVDNVTDIMQGYLSTPLNLDVLVYLTKRPDDLHDDHPYGWQEYAYWGGQIYPEFLNTLAEAGIAFSWEFDCTEDFHYGAYNLPTVESPNNLIVWDSGTKRKSKPKLSKKAIAVITETSAANELLYILGIKHGSN